MAEFSKLVITKKGQALIAKMLAGTATDIDFTKVTASVTDEKGVHGLRYANEELQVQDQDGKWKTAGSGAGAISAHNEDENAHADIRLAVKNAQDAADKAAAAVSKIAYTIDVVPTQNGSLTYNGQTQSPVWNSFNPETLKITGDTEKIDAGTYTAIFTPIGEYAWTDGSKNPKTVIWTIGKAALTIPTQANSPTYTGNQQSPTWNNYDSGKMPRAEQPRGQMPEVTRRHSFPAQIISGRTGQPAQRP